MSTITSISDIYEKFKQTTEICTDTRKVSKNCFFVALKGANFNGNEFAKQALENGAKYALVDEVKYVTSEKCILVEDALTSLQDLARHHRRQFNIPFIGITGSNGKTTSKELVSCVLKTKYKTHFTLGNFNNHIGVPLTLLSMPLDTEIAVIEMGANHVGEIEQLCNIAEPTHGFITNIGKAHLEGFGGIEGVARGKSELFRFLQNHNGVIFINGSSEALMRMATRFSNPFIYSQTDKNAYVYGVIKELNPFIQLNYNKEIAQQTHLIGAYNFENILAALAIAKYFNIEDKQAVDAICNYIPSNNRSQVIEKNGIEILLDAYNANPTSMTAAIENLKSVDHKYKIAILGDMFELGTDSNKEHIELYHKAMNQGFTYCYFVGNHFKKAIPEANNVFATKEELLNVLRKIELKSSLTLIKGSRGIGLETILDSLQG